MATILMTWELGAGFGHVTSLASLAKPLLERGHRVIAVVRDLTRASTAFDGLNVELIQAPIKVEIKISRSTDSYAHILQTNGFDTAHELSALAGAWRRLMQQLQPDMILFDHSPTALLASRGLICQRAAIGTGFYCPPADSPLPTLRRWEEVNADQLVKDERAVLDNINEVLTFWGESGLRSVGELFATLDERFFLTLPALDCYGIRDGVTYLGPPKLEGGISPVWPDGDGKKVFAYLKPFKSIGALFTRLKQMGNPTLVYAPEIPLKTQQKLTGPNIRFSPERINMQEALATCDTAILNGTNAASCDALIAGKPALHIPQVLEQVLNALAVQDLGAGLIARADFDDEVDRHVQALLNGQAFADTANAFAASLNRVPDPIAVIAARIEEMVAR